MREIKWSDLNLLKRIGSGGFSTVWLATWHDEEVAVKKLLEHAVDETDAVRKIKGVGVKGLDVWFLPPLREVLSCCRV